MCNVEIAMFISFAVKFCRLGQGCQTAIRMLAGGWGTAHCHGVLELLEWISCVLPPERVR